MFRIPGTRRYSNVYHRNTGYFYHCSHVTNSAAYFKCERYDSGCRGRAILYRDEYFLETGYHDHVRNRGLRLQRLMRADILRSVRQNPHLTFRDIVRIEGTRYPLSVRSLITADRMRSAMLRMRLRDFPQIPDTLLELSNYLRDPQYAHISMCEGENSSIHAATVEASDGSINIIFISERMMDMMGEVRWLFADGHFASKPSRPHCSQILNLVTASDNHAVLLGSVLMENRTEQAYRAVFSTLRQLMPNLSPEFIMTDFEAAQQNAWRWAFPDAIILGCFWHFCRAIVKKASNLGLMMWLRRSRLVRRLLRICCSIALLPTPLLLHGLFEAAVECYRYGQFVYNLFHPLLTYLYTSWITHPTRSQSMSVYNSEHRTNNVCESTNRWMRHEVGPHHPNPYTLIGVFRRLESMSYSTVHTLSLGRQPARPRRTSAVSNDINLQRLYNQLRRRPFGLRYAIRNVLFYGNNTFRNAFNDLIHHDGDEDL